MNLFSGIVPMSKKKFDMNQITCKLLSFSITYFLGKFVHEAIFIFIRLIIISTSFIYWVV